MSNLHFSRVLTALPRSIMQQEDRGRQVEAQLSQANANISYLQQSLQQARQGASQAHHINDGAMRAKLIRFESCACACDCVCVSQTVSFVGFVRLRCVRVREREWMIGWLFTIYASSCANARRACVRACTHVCSCRLCVCSLLHVGALVHERMLVFTMTFIKIQHMRLLRAMTHHSLVCLSVLCLSI